MSSDIWHVMLPNGVVRSGTLDQLDEAFKQGAVSADTLVFGPNQRGWARLGAVAGLDEPAPPSPRPAPPRPEPVISAPPSSVRPVSLDLEDIEEAAWKDAQPKKKKRGRLFFASVVVLGGAAAFAWSKGMLPPKGGWRAPVAVAAQHVAVGAASLAVKLGAPPPAPPPAPALAPCPVQAAPAPPPAPPKVEPPPAPPPKVEPPKVDPPPAPPKVEPPPAPPKAEPAPAPSSKAQVDADKRKGKPLPKASDARPSRSAARSHDGPFHNGGDPHDPLNGAL